MFRSGLLGRLNPQTSHVTVVGGGISGLLAAYYFKRQGYEVELCEASTRTGGLIATLQTAYGPVETAAHSFLMTDAVAKLIDELGLEIVRPQQKARFIVRDGVPRRFPLKPTEVARLIAGLLMPVGPEAKNWSLSEWAHHRLGKAGAEYLMEPALAGIYAGDSAQMTLSAAFPTLAFRKKGDKRPRSKKRGMFTFQKGTQSLVDALSEKLGDSLRLGEEVTHLGRLLQGSNVVLATPANVSAKLLRTAGIDAALADSLDQVEYLPLASVGVFVKRERLTRFRDGVGVLVPKVETRGVNGILFNSSAFQGRVKDESVVSLTLLLGGAANRGVINQSDADIRNLVTSELKRLLGLSGELEHVTISRWPRALPHYTRSLEALWPKLEQRLPAGLLLFGNYTGQISIRGMIESLDRAV